MIIIRQSVILNAVRDPVMKITCISHYTGFFAGDPKKQVMFRLLGCFGRSSAEARLFVVQFPSEEGWQAKPDGVVHLSKLVITTPTPSRRGINIHF